MLIVLTGFVTPPPKLRAAGHQQEESAEDARGATHGGSGVQPHHGVRRDQGHRPVGGLRGADRVGQGQAGHQPAGWPEARDGDRSGRLFYQDGKNRKRKQLVDFLVFLSAGSSYGALVDWMDSTPAEVALWERMKSTPNEWVEDVLSLRMLNPAKATFK